MVLKRPLQIFNGFWGDHHHWMFLGGLTIAINGFTMVFWCCYHRFQWFLMVLDHWSNDGMVSMDRCGLVVGYSWRDPLGRFGMTQFVDVGPETTIWTFDPLCWSTNLLLCRKNPNVHFVVSPILSDTICWFGSNNESTICTIDQFCWCGWLFLKSTFLTVDKFCWFVVDTESTIFVNWPDLTKSTDRLTFIQINLLDD